MTTCGCSPTCCEGERAPQVGGSSLEANVNAAVAVVSPGCGTVAAHAQISLADASWRLNCCQIRFIVYMFNVSPLYLQGMRHNIDNVDNV